LNRVTNIEILSVEVKEVPGKKSTYKKMEIAYKAFNTFTKKVDLKTAHLVDFAANPDLWNALVNANKGDTFMILETKDDKYWNFTGLAGDHDLEQVKQQGAPTQVSNYSRPAQENADSRQQSIVRQSSLKAAVDFILATKAEGLTVDDVLAIAEDFESWVNR
jgi:hypothetical protein